MTVNTSRGRLTAAAGPGPAHRTWAPLAVMLTGTFMIVLDFFIVNVTIPSIQRAMRRALAHRAAAGHRDRHGHAHRAAHRDRPRHVAPQHVGAVSGLQSTTVQLGNSLGVAVIGVVFFGALAGGFGHAFGAALAWLTVLPLAAAVAIQVLPRRSG